MSSVGTALLALSALSGAGERGGVIAVALLAGVSVLAGARPTLERWRTPAMLGALVLTPVLLLADIWDSPQLAPLRQRPILGAAAALGALVLVAVLGLAIRRRPEVFPMLALAALPFRIPISSGGATSNLLVPLYAVVAAGVLARALGWLGRRRESPGAAVGRLELGLVGLVVLYAVQAAYSSDFSRALEQVVFFYVPFALLFALLRDVVWTPRLLGLCLAVIVGLALVFVVIGFVEYDRRELLLNPKVIAANQVQTYFRVNSLFFDPNIYGRFLAVVMIAVTGVLLWSRRAHTVALCAAVLLVLLAGLVLSFSQSSIGALLLGLAVLGALRWSVRGALVATAGALAVGVVIVIVAPRAVHFDVGSSQAADKATSGRYDLIRGGVELFALRPVQGFGPAAFGLEYRRRKHATMEGAVSASHTIPITVAAEQGVIGLGVYLALLAAALSRLFSGARASAARSILTAAFAALILHTLLYASFLEDPLTWTLLAIGTALAAGQREPPTRRTAGPGSVGDVAGG